MAFEIHLADPHRELVALGGRRVEELPSAGDHDSGETVEVGAPGE